MNKSFSISFLLIFYCSIVLAQNNINSYKYILVPKQFEFQKSVDQHQINSLTKFLFKKAGYKVLYTDEQFPEDLVKNNCLALKTEINSNPSLFRTKMSIDLYDCYNKIVFSTREAISKKKEYKKAYQEAIRLAFVDIENLNYAYDTTSETSTKNKSESQELVVTPKEVEVTKVETLKEVIAVPKINKTKPIEEAKAVLKVTEDIAAPLKYAENISVKTIVGKFNFDKWGISTISKKENDYVAVGGDENFEFATIYKTSKPRVFIIKWVAYKQPQLLEIDSNGDLKVDTENGINSYKRVD